MNRRRIVLVVSSLIILALVLVIFFDASMRLVGKVHPSGNNQTQAPLLSRGTSTAASSSASSPGSAFAGGENNSNIFFPLNPSNEVSPSSPTTSGISIGASGTKVTSLSDVRNIISSTLSTEKPATTTLLALPDVPDSEINISSSGVSSTLDYLTYFGVHSQNIAFNSKEFNSVLKDRNGIVLFVPGLIDKAIADNNFLEIASSLLVQEQFTEAEINFLKSMPVTGTAVAINKENIGLEELEVGLVNKAIAVSSGSTSESELVNYYDQFKATAETARQNFTTQSGILSLGKPPSLFDRILGALGIGTAVRAQVVNTPFGGTITFIQPCPCDIGVNVIVGPPVPADLFVPFPFFATPLFFPDYSVAPGAWWLGLYNPADQFPCLTAPICEPDGAGGLIIMTGTSLAP